jgi:hypothetical protein
VFLLPYEVAWSCVLDVCVDHAVLRPLGLFFLKPIRLSMTYPLKNCITDLHFNFKNLPPTTKRAAAQSSLQSNLYFVQTTSKTALSTSSEREGGLWFDLGKGICVIIYSSNSVHSKAISEYAHVNRSALLSDIRKPYKNMHMLKPYDQNCVFFFRLQL